MTDRPWTDADQELMASVLYQAGELEKRECYRPAAAVLDALATIRRGEADRLRARVAELEQQLWQIRDAMTDQHEAIGHALNVHAWGEEDPDCIAAADQMDGDLACEQWKRWQDSFSAAMALNIGLRPAPGAAHETEPSPATVPLADHPALEWLAVVLVDAARDGDGSNELHSRLSAWLADRQATGLDQTPRDTCDCESYEPCHGECCGHGRCSCSACHVPIDALNLCGRTLPCPVHPEPETAGGEQ